MNLPIDNLMTQTPTLQSARAPKSFATGVAAMDMR
jgi:hypothetical protein